MSVTIKDIANETGLSVATISLVLNNKANKISDKTKKLVMETANRLNYHPNQLAIGLVKQKTKTLGLIVFDISNPFFSELARGVDDEAHAQGRDIILSSTNNQADRDICSLNNFCARGVDAIILAMSSDIDEDKQLIYQKVISQLAIPVILVDSHDPSFHCSCVQLDNRKGSYIAATHLLSLGHRNIACITGPSGMHTTQERLEGFAWTLKNAGLPFDEKYIFEGNCFHQSGYAAAKKILQTDATAIFAFNDMMAFGAFRLLRETGISIPDDMSIVGFDDVYFTELLEVPLTTIRQPAYEIGREAVRRALVEIGNHNAIKQNILFEPELIVRKSSAACKGERQHK